MPANETLVDYAASLRQLGYAKVSANWNGPDGWHVRAVPRPPSSPLPPVDAWHDRDLRLALEAARDVVRALCHEHEEAR